MPSLSEEVQRFLDSYRESQRESVTLGDFTNVCLHAGMNAADLLEAAGKPVFIPHPRSPDELLLLRGGSGDAARFYRLQWFGTGLQSGGWWRRVDGQRYSGPLERLNNMVWAYRQNPGLLLEPEGIPVQIGGDTWEFLQGKTVLMQFASGVRMAVGRVRGLLKDMGVEQRLDLLPGEAEVERTLRALEWPDGDGEDEGGEGDAL